MASSGTVHVRSDGTVVVEQELGCVRRAVPSEASRVGLRWFHNRRPESEQKRGLGFSRKRDAVAALVAAAGEGE